MPGSGSACRTPRRPPDGGGVPDTRSGRRRPYAPPRDTRWSGGRPRRVRQRAALVAPGDRPPRGRSSTRCRARRASRPSPPRSPPRCAPPAGPSPPPSSRPGGSSSCTTPRARRRGTGTFRAGHAGAGDARGRGRRGPDARRGGLDLVHGRARGVGSRRARRRRHGHPGAVPELRRPGAPLRADRAGDPRVVDRRRRGSRPRTCRPGARCCAPPPASNHCPTASSPSGQGADHRLGGATRTGSGSSRRVTMPMTGT